MKPKEHGGVLDHQILPTHQVLSTYPHIHDDMMDEEVGNVQIFRWLPGFTMATASSIVMFGLTVVLLFPKDVVSHFLPNTISNPIAAHHGYHPRVNGIQYTPYKLSGSAVYGMHHLWG